MWEWLIPVLIVVALVVIAGIYLWATYNSLVQLNVRVDEAWSDITVQLKRTRRSAAEPHRGGEGLRGAREGGVRERHAGARRDAVGRAGPAEAGVAEGHMQQALKSLFAVAEAYPAAPGEPELPAAAAVDRRHRRQGPGVAPLLQRRCARAEHEDQGLPEQPLRPQPRLQRARVLRGRRRRRDLRAAARPVLSERSPGFTRVAASSARLFGAERDRLARPRVVAARLGHRVGEVVGRVAPARDRDVSSPCQRAASRSSSATRAAASAGVPCSHHADCTSSVDAARSALRSTRPTMSSPTSTGSE